ncbi:TlpA family protein disulfide reductase [Sphingobacterium thalpophilum]|uniref:TlpA family protein disulfide reductase n=1 Tax=Sphingobacterium thalpophilum TaxID=259 RepID=UPI003DA4F7ED
MNTLKFLAFLRGYITCIFQALVKHRYSTDIVLFTQLLRKQIYKGKTYFKSTYLVLRKCRNKRGSSDFLLTNFALSSALVRAGHRSCMHVSSGFLRVDSMKSRCRPDENPMNGRSWSGVGGYLSIPLSYRECTEKVLKRYRRATKKLLEIYQRGTKQLQAFGSFLVKLGYKLRTGSGSSLRVMFGRSIRRADVYRLKFSGLQTLCRVLMVNDESLAVQKKLNTHNVLKCVGQFGGYRKAFRMSLACVFLVSMFSLSAQTPRKDSGADGLSDLVALKPGDKIPDAVWNRPLELNYFNGKKKTIKFAELKGKLILLDFWSTGCPSCIEGIPKMEWIQQRFPDDIQIIMVNSKRNKDTAKRIKTRFEKFKSDFDFTPSLPTVLDDTIFTALFAHNTLPALAVVDTNGAFIAMTSSHSLTDKNIQALLDGNAVLKNEGNYKNLIRNAAEPLLDTTGVHYISAFGGYREHYLPVYPNLNHKNGTTFLQMGNQSLQFMLFQAYGQVLKGFRQNDLVIDGRLGRQFKEKLLNVNSDQNKYWYQFYTSDSISHRQFADIFCREFQNHFKIAVARKRDSVELYKIQFSDKIKTIRTSGKASIARFQGIGEEAFYQNIPIGLFLQNLFYAFDLPTELQEKENFKIDITVPAGFVSWTEQKKLSFLKERGIIFTAVKEYRSYPFVYPIY